jgi:hypothetical protein
MNWTKIFKDTNDYNEKTILGALSFCIMVLIIFADLITGMFGKHLPMNEYMFNAFVYVTLGSFGISAVEKRRNGGPRKIKPDSRPFPDERV